MAKENLMERPDSQEPRDYGHNVKATLEFGRHETPGKITEGPKVGMSADFLTDEGQEKAIARGKTIKEPAVKDYTSPKERAQQTGELGLHNVDEGVRVINRKISEAKPGVIVGQKESNEFIMRTKKELDTAGNFAAIMPEAKAWAEKQIKEGSKKNTYELVVQYFLDHPERAEELGAETPQQCAEDIAYRASIEMKITKRLYDDSEVRMRNFTHGPKLEPFLQEIMIKEDGETGFQSLDEIGGVLAPGEGFEFKLERNGDELKVKLLFRDKEYDIDLDKLEELAVNYRKREK